MIGRRNFGTDRAVNDIADFADDLDEVAARFCDD